MSDAIVGALIGGGFALVGGLVGAWLLSLFEDRRAARESRTELVAAIRVVHSEMTALSAGLKTLMDRSGRAVHQPLNASAFEQVRLVLARGLPPATYKSVSIAYLMIPIVRREMDASVAVGVMSEGQRRACQYARERMEAGATALLVFEQGGLQSNESVVDSKDR